MRVRGAHDGLAGGIEYFISLTAEESSSPFGALVSVQVTGAPGVDEVHVAKSTNGGPYSAMDPIAYVNQGFVDEGVTGSDSLQYRMEAVDVGDNVLGTIFSNVLEPWA